MATVTDSSKPPALRREFVIVDVLIILYIVLDAVAQSLPPHYSPISQAESLLAVGPYGYVMTVNFLNRGVFTLLFLYAFLQLLTMLGENWRNYKFGLYAIAIWGVAALLLAGFPATGSTLATHTIIAIIIFIATPLGELSLSLKLRRVKAFAGVRTIALVVAALAVFFLVFYLGVLTFLPHFKADYGGLFERFLIGSVIAWMGIVAAYFLRQFDTPLKAERLGAAAS